MIKSVKIPNLFRQLGPKFWNLGKYSKYRVRLCRLATSYNSVNEQNETEQPFGTYILEKPQNDSIEQILAG